MEIRDERLADIEERVAEACGVLAVAHARLVTLTAELIESELWRGYGIRSVEHWLTLKAGLSPERARQIAEVARAAAQLPVTTAALRDGELSFEQAHAVARHPDKFVDSQAAAFAKVATVPQIRRTLTRYTFAVDDAADDSGADAGADIAAGADTSAKAAVAPGRLSKFHDVNRYSLHVDAPPDQGALIEAALNEAKDFLFQAGKPDVTWFDALLEVCNRSLSAVEPTSRADKYRVYVHLDTAGAWLNAGPSLPTGLLTKLTCNGSIAPVWETDGKPVNVGRTARIVPERTRRLVEDRDRGCRYPGCSARSYLEVHHVIHWRDGGSTDTDNLACLCPHHHDAHHRGDFLISGNADVAVVEPFVLSDNANPLDRSDRTAGVWPPATELGADGFGQQTRRAPAGRGDPSECRADALRFTDSRGNSISVGRPRPPSEPLPLPPPGHRYRHPAGEPVQSRWVSFAAPSKSHTA